MYLTLNNLQRLICHETQTNVHTYIQTGVHFGINIFGKDMNSLTPSTYGLNSTIPVRLKRLLQHLITHES